MRILSPSISGADDLYLRLTWNLWTLTDEVVVMSIIDDLRLSLLKTSYFNYLAFRFSLIVRWHVINDFGTMQHGIPFLPLESHHLVLMMIGQIWGLNEAQLSPNGWKLRSILLNEWVLRSLSNIMELRNLLLILDLCSLIKTHGITVSRSVKVQNVRMTLEILSKSWRAELAIVILIEYWRRRERIKIWVLLNRLLSYELRRSLGFCQIYIVVIGIISINSCFLF